MEGGFTQLLRGTQADAESGREGVGVVLVTDRGYIYVPPNLAPGNVNFTEWCEANDIRLLHPYNEGEGAFTYDGANNVFIWNPDEVDEVRQDLRVWLYPT